MQYPSPAEADDTLTRALARVTLMRNLTWRVFEAGLMLVGVILLVFLLLGTGSGPFVLGVVANVQVLVAALTPQAMIGVAIVVAMSLWLRAK
jgi:hypothetical protein